MGHYCDGVRLYTAVAGDGPLVVLVHGWPECWYSWQHQIGPLAAPDLRGYGGSDKPEAIEAYDMSSLVGDVLGLIDHFGDADLDYYTRQFEAGGFGPPLHRYRNQRRDWELLPELSEARIRPPSCFLAGTREIVLSFVPGVDLIENMKQYTDDLRVCRLFEGAGHWLQQKRPEETNEALLSFIAELER